MRAQRGCRGKFVNEGMLQGKGKPNGHDGFSAGEQRQCVGFEDMQIGPSPV